MTTGGRREEGAGATTGAASGAGAACTGTMGLATGDARSIAEATAEAGRKGLVTAFAGSVTRAAVVGLSTNIALYPSIVIVPGRAPHEKGFLPI